MNRDESASNLRLLAALSYAKQGFAVLPCRAKGKRPATPHGYKDGTTDRGKLIAAWKRAPDCNVGIVTGTQSGIVVLDIDPRNGGNESMRELERLHGSVPTTCIASSGGDGQHIYFAIPEGAGIKSSQYRPGIDLKSDGGYVIAPPSVHPSGGEYNWLVPLTRDALAPAPQWLIESQGETGDGNPSISPRVPQPNGDALDTPLGRLFAEHNMVGRQLSDGKLTVTCPWLAEHSTGEEHDSSTVLFPPSEQHPMGGFYCFHEHCRSRGTTAAFRELERRKDAGVKESGWMRLLDRTDKGDIRSTFRNVCNILTHDRNYGEMLRYNEMSGSILLHDQDMTDGRISKMRIDMDERFEVRPAEAEVIRAVNYVGESHRFHPVREFLSELQWDGTPRIDQVCSDILRVRVDSDGELKLLSLQVRRWFISLVARPFNPGVKVDTALILQGHQGAGKSTFFKALAGDWFADSDMGLDKDGMMLLNGAWIYEWAELENVFGRNAQSRIKAFITSSEDSFRRPFGKHPIKLKRSGVIVGTTNLDDFLHDPTGSRRFWVIPIGKIDIELLAAQREQLLAEAVTLYRNKESYWLSPAEERARCAFAERFTDADVWEAVVLAYARQQEFVRIEDILRDPLDVAPAKQTRRDQIRVAAILRRAGYERHQRRFRGVKARVWVKPADNSESSEEPQGHL